MYKVKFQNPKGLNKIRTTFKNLSLKSKTEWNKVKVKNLKDAKIKWMKYIRIKKRKSKSNKPSLKKLCQNEIS